MIADAVRDALANVRGRPVIVCAQAGNVNTGSFDPLADITRLAREHGRAWVHVDGAFGLWAAASPALMPDSIWSVVTAPRIATNGMNTTAGNGAKGT